ncbi:uncharacterized protein BKA78DRAFT_300388 [Phyllosticta capitalensis]|uniref:uncharacterized protein n=1 Tax=Phyllosticta capitalensis TaxID=121624 RepID=UPI00312E1B51
MDTMDTVKLRNVDCISDEWIQGLIKHIYKERTGDKNGIRVEYAQQKRCGPQLKKLANSHYCRGASLKPDESVNWLEIQALIQTEASKPKNKCQYVYIFIKNLEREVHQDFPRWESDIFSWTLCKERDLMGDDEISAFGLRRLKRGLTGEETGVSKRQRKE